MPPSALRPLAGCALVAAALSRRLPDCPPRPPSAASAATIPSTPSTACSRPLDPVTTLVPGSFYVATIACLDCPVADANATAELHRPDNALFLNVSLTPDKHALLLNHHPIFPSLPTSPHPPPISIPQVPPSFSHASLAAATACSPHSCDHDSPSCPCLDPLLGRCLADYDYHARPLGAPEDTQWSEQWEVTFDPIGAHAAGQHDLVFPINNTAQLMLKLTVQGRPVESEPQERYRGEKDMQAASSLFGGVGDQQETVYDLRIVRVDTVPRTYAFSSDKQRSIWTKIRYFFTGDIVRNDGHVVYIQREWGPWGKKGSLRNYVGTVIHDWPWLAILLTAGGVVGAVFALHGLYRLFLLLRRERHLARWEGMDDVWKRMREQRPEDEDGLLDGRYQDEPDEDSPPSYTDEVQTNKPLPSKPLPEKPLPAVPLIDA